MIEKLFVKLPGAHVKVFSYCTVLPHLSQFKIPMHGIYLNSFTVLFLFFFSLQFCLWVLFCYFYLLSLYIQSIERASSHCVSVLFFFVSHFYLFYWLWSFTVRSFSPCNHWFCLILSCDINTVCNALFCNKYNKLVIQFTLACYL